MTITQLPKLCVKITINARLTATDHISGLLSSCSSLLYMLRILRSHGISDTSLQDVFRATVLSKLTYCSAAWSGYCTAADLGRLDGFLRRCRRLGYCEQSQSSIAELFSDIDDTFLVALSLILNIFYNSFYMIVQAPTLSDQEIIVKF